MLHDYKKLVQHPHCSCSRVKGSHKQDQHHLYLLLFPFHDKLHYKDAQTMGFSQVWEEHTWASLWQLGRRAAGTTGRSQGITGIILAKGTPWHENWAQTQEFWHHFSDFHHTCVNCVTRKLILIHFWYPCLGKILEQNDFSLQWEHSGAGWDQAYIQSSFQS